MIRGEESGICFNFTKRFSLSVMKGLCGDASKTDCLISFNDFLFFCFVCFYLNLSSVRVKGFGEEPEECDLLHFFFLESNFRAFLLHRMSRK